MKNTILTFICFCSLNSFSQLSLKKLDGTPINNNDVITFTSNIDPESYLGIKFYNSSNQDINIKAEVVSMINATGTNLQFCFGNICVGTISQGSTYPDMPAIIPANGQNGNFDHFLNTASGINSSANIEYVLKFYQVDANDVEIGNNVTFTYKYAPNLATNAFFANFKPNIYPNPSNGIVKINTENEVAINVIDILGKVVYSNNKINKNSIMDFSDLQKGIYVLQIIDENINSSQKLILD